MKDRIQELRQEHQKILSMLGQKEILKLLDFVEHVHHPKEEIFLFPLLAMHPRLREGGPRCTYFRGLLMDLQIHAPAQKVLAEYYRRGGPLPSPYKNFDWLKENNPLSIPMDEHRLGHELASALREILTGNTPTARAELFVDLYAEYCRLIKLHIEKEDTCLFVMAESMLNST